MTPNPAGEAQHAAQQAGQQATHAAQQAGQQATHVADQAQQQASHAAGVARRQAMSQLSKQKVRVASEVEGVAGALEQTGQQWRQQNHGAMAEYAETTAEQLKRVSHQLEQKDITEFVRDAESVARRRPTLFLGGAFALGLLGARFLKSSPDTQSPSPESAAYDPPYSAATAPAVPATGTERGADPPASPPPSRAT